jgi:glycerophosphoryl diester phosphodiesterase
VPPGVASSRRRGPTQPGSAARCLQLRGTEVGAAPRLVHLVAHRGNAQDCPENTLPAFQSAIDLGVRFLELDIQLSADHVPMVIHDHLLARTTGETGTVFERTAAELGALNAGERHRFGDRYAHVRVPRLVDVIELLSKRHEVTLFAEIKRASLRQFGHETVVPRVLEVLKPLRARCVVISFDLAAIHMARQQGAPAIGWVIREYDGHERLKFEALRPEYLFCDYLKLPPSGNLWRGPWRWALYEVTDPAVAMSLAGRGADFIETMAVAPMVEALRSENRAPG